MPDLDSSTAQKLPSSVGTRVDPEKIDKELKLLWESSEGATTRASLINLAIYSEANDALQRNSMLLQDITRDHACRAIVIAANRGAQESRVQSWINAHCHISRAGAKQICSEAISFSLEGRAVDQITKVVFSHLDSDLPLFFWWQGELRELDDKRFWGHVDRLFVDSADWRSPGQQVRLIHQICEQSPKTLIRDLNWTRFVYLREATAQFFDLPAAVEQIPALNELTVWHAEGARLTSFLFIGWLASLFGWKLDRYNMERTELTMKNAEGGEITVKTSPASGAWEGIVSVHLAGPGSHFDIRCEDSSARHYITKMQLPGQQEFTRIMPMGSKKAVDLMNEELARASRSRAYPKALEAIQELL